MWLLWLLSLAIAACLAVAFRYLVYKPLPAAIRQQGKILLLNDIFNFLYGLAFMMEWLGYGHRITCSRNTYDIPGTIKKSKTETDEDGLVVSITAFNGVPVRVYQPPPKAGESRLKRGLLYMHGGGWAYGSPDDEDYDYNSRKACKELHMVVVSVDYRMYPETCFPVAYHDCLMAAKHFLSPEVLAKYGVDPLRVGVAGDSAGGNLSAALAQTIATDDSMHVKFSVQALIYPVLQALDFNTPSYQQNRDMVFLDRSFMIQLWLQYLGGELSLKPHLLANEHNHELSPELRARLDWTVLLSPEYQKGFVPARVEGKKMNHVGLLDAIPTLLDVRASPLLAEDKILAKCPKAYVMTCEYDVLRDDGLMYARRLRDAGVAVTTEHHLDGFHACFNLIEGFFGVDVGVRSLNSYLRWLRDNL
ncbi:neutral cholesterol ester hydrolase 1-like [Corythoichthys intestinalis]|uniref:neutral cholesterol ester hydrolase 1-like n=1 Tax=Corythoichthys intestinalis TaxID=161448 RepID=UPI0025A58FC9|nr:neutral cholesterol ester hydrolase 1-like [Corythoichthys intestinalis]XP_061798294.1 neutral cholesterol ester hydrolase 1-like [Nerophis lumbriciformis]